MPEPVSSSPVIFIWKDAKGVSHTVTPKFSAAGISLPDTGEDMPDFYYFAATVMVGSIENAGRFSELSKANRHKQFVQTFTKEYPWIRDLNVEVHAGSPAVFATLKGSNRKIPVANISTGINRALGFMLAIALRPRAIVLIDEIENGIHYAHLAAIWRSILSLAREYETQLFISTHSRECLEALLEASGGEVNDLEIWRTEREGTKHTIRRFRGKDFQAGIEGGEEIR